MKNTDRKKLTSWWKHNFEVDRPLTLNTTFADPFAARPGTCFLRLRFTCLRQGHEGADRKPTWTTTTAWALQANQAFGSLLYIFNQFNLNDKFCLVPLSFGWPYHQKVAHDIPLLWPYYGYSLSSASICILCAIHRLWKLLGLIARRRKRLQPVATAGWSATWALLKCSHPHGSAKTRFRNRRLSIFFHIGPLNPKSGCCRHGPRPSRRQILPHLPGEGC